MAVSPFFGPRAKGCSTSLAFGLVSSSRGQQQQQSCLHESQEGAIVMQVCHPVNRSAFRLPGCQARDNTPGRLCLAFLGL